MVKEKKRRNKLQISGVRGDTTIVPTYIKKIIRE